MLNKRVTRGLARSRALLFWSRRHLPGLLTQSDRILINGCGEGPEILQLSIDRRFKDCWLVGNDIDYLGLSAAREILKRQHSCQKVDLVLADSNNLPFSDSQFRFISCTYVLEHIEKRKMAVSEMYRVIQASGWALITVPTTLRIIRHALKDGLLYSLTHTVPSARRRDLKEGLSRRGSGFRAFILSFLTQLKIIHGEYSSLFGALRTTLSTSWLRFMRASDFDLVVAYFPRRNDRISKPPGELMFLSSKFTCGDHQLQRKQLKALLRGDRKSSQNAIVLKG